MAASLQRLILVLVPLLALSCDRMGDPPRWWYEARGTLQMRFTIDPEGAVTTHCIDPVTTIDDEGLGECVLARFSELKFAPDDGYTIVVYPIVFAPGP